MTSSRQQWSSPTATRRKRTKTDSIGLRVQGLALVDQVLVLARHTAYSIGCAGVWGVILLLARRRLDPQTRNTFRLVCSGWWIGWTTATIARIGYPAPKQLTPAAEKRLRIVSIALIALGLMNIIRVLATGKRPPGSAPGT